MAPMFRCLFPSSLLLGPPQERLPDTWKCGQFLIAVLLLIGIVTPVHSVELQSQDWSSRLNYRYGTFEEERVQTEVEVAPRFDWAFNNRTNVILSARLRGDQRDQLVPNQPNRRTYANGSRIAAFGNHITAELRDAYVQWQVKDGQIRLGKQQIVWGALDGIKVLDVLNPQSFEQFILDDFDRSRIPLWSAYGDWSIRNWRTEIALIPDSTVHDLPVPGAWFALTAPRFRFGFDTSDGGIAIEQNGARSSKGSAGIRLSRSFGATDVQWVASRGPDFEPVGSFDLDSETPRLEISNPRRTLVGFAAQHAVSDFVFRVEAGYSPSRTLNVADGTLDRVERSNWRAAVGIDAFIPGGWFVNLQYLHDVIESGPEVLIREKRERLATAVLRRSFIYETLDLEMRLYYGIDFDDRLVDTSIRYRISDRTAIKLTYDDFRGDRRGPFGQFDRRDQIRLTLTLNL